MIRQGRLVEIDSDFDLVLYEYYAKSRPKVGPVLGKPEDEDDAKQLEEEANERPGIEDGEGAPPSDDEPDED